VDIRPLTGLICGMGDDEQPVFDDDFVRGAAFREAALGKPSRASLREVKREARARRRTVAGRPPRKRAPQEGRWRRAGASAAVLALLGGVVTYAVSSQPGPPVRSKDAPIVVPSYSPPPRSTDIFADSKVAAWPIGAAGIVAPVAASVGKFTAKQVGDAYARTVAYVRSAMLDRSVLYGSATAPVLSTIRADSAKRRAGEPAQLMTRFDPRLVEPASDVVRVNGQMTASLAKDALRIKVTFVGVYALRPVATTDALGELVAVRRMATLEFHPQQALPWVYSAAYISDRSSCGAEGPEAVVYVTADLQPPLTSAPPTDASPSGPTVDFNILDPTAKEPDGCFKETSGLRSG
jgi:hypothetical protein